MKGITQKYVNDVDGDCFGACVASILELEEVPNFHSDADGPWLKQWSDWLYERGFGLAWFNAHIPWLRGYGIASVPSALFPDSTHAIVWEYGENGKIAWNPNPDDPRGLEILNSDVTTFYVLTVLNPTL